MDGQGGHCGDVVQAFLKVVCKDNKGNQKKIKILTLNNKFNTMTPEDYVSYPLALALKKHGFDYPCYFYYTRKDAPDDHVWSTTSEEAPIDYNRSVYAGCSMPTLAQAQKWLREEWGIHVYPTLESVNEVSYDCHIVHLRKDAFRVNKRYCSYESALSAGIAAALELIEKNKNN